MGKNLTGDFEVYTLFRLDRTRTMFQCTQDQFQMVTKIEQPRVVSTKRMFLFNHLSYNTALYSSEGIQLLRTLKPIIISGML